MRSIDPSEHEFVAKVWLVQHQGYSEEYASNHWERVELIPANYDDEDYFYCDGRRYRVTNEWRFVAPKRWERAAVPSEMVRAAQVEWLDTRPAGYATQVIADSEVQAFEDTRFMSDEELADLVDGDKLPAGQRAAIWVLAALFCGVVFSMIAVIVMGMA